MNVQLAVDNDIHPPRFGGAQRSFGLRHGVNDHVPLPVPWTGGAFEDPRAAFIK